MNMKEKVKENKKNDFIDNPSKQSNKDVNSLSRISSIPSQVNQTNSKNFFSKRNRSASMSSIKKGKLNNQYDIHDNPFYPKNFNVYRHLTNHTLKLKPTEIKWSIELRGYPKMKYISKEEQLAKLKNQIPPRFYEEDLEKYIKKKGMKHSNSAKTLTSTTSSNWRLLRHLTKSSNGQTVTANQFNFATTLREFKPTKGVFINSKEWVNHTGELKRPSTCYLKGEQKNEKFIMRPYSVIKDRVEIGKDTIIRRKYMKNKTEAYDWFGEHYSSPPFNDVYQEKNFQAIKNYLCEGRRTVSECMFQLGLRQSKYHRLVVKEDKKNQTEGKIKKNKFLS